jgi:mono/diheme cytochrome c family protein
MSLSGVRSAVSVSILLHALLLVSSPLAATGLDDLDGGVVAARDADDAVARGKYVLHAAGCITCHTEDTSDAVPLAGGRVLRTDFGVFHSPNITPDADTGIGGWTAAQFRSAIRQGQSPDGHYYYPSFPYTSYAAMQDQDIDDLFAYLQALQPVRNEVADHELSWPYRWRSLLTPWRWLYFDAGFEAPHRDGEDRWNRGAYLVNALGHCGECHTPRNSLGALDRSRHLGGHPGSEHVPAAPDITTAGAVGSWSRDDLLVLFQYGLDPDNDVPGGGMGAVIFDSLAVLDGDDLEAMVDYLQSLRPE